MAATTRPTPHGAPYNGDYCNDGRFDHVVDGVNYFTWASNYGQSPNDGERRAIQRTGRLTANLLGPTACLMGNEWQSEVRFARPAGAGRLSP